MKRLVTMNNKIPILCNLVGQFNEICSNLTLLKYQRVCAQKIQSYHIYIENFGSETKLVPNVWDWYWV